MYLHMHELSQNILISYTFKISLKTQVCTCIYRLRKKTETEKG